MKSKLKTHTNIKRGGLVACALIGSLLWASLGWGTTYYCDPVSGDTDNYDGLSPTVDGGGVGPWGTLQSVIEALKFKSQDAGGNPKNPSGDIAMGDTVCLLDGYHGDCRIRGYFNTSYTTITNYNGSEPHLKRIYFSDGGSYWKWENLVISYYYDSEDDPLYSQYTVTFDYDADGTDHIYFDNCTVYSAPQSVCDTWTTAQDWIDNGVRGFSFDRADYVTVTNCTVINAGVGVSTNVGSNYTITHNYFRYLYADGCHIERTDDIDITDNIFKSFLVIDENHADGIQLTAVSDPSDSIDNLNIFRNKIIAYDPVEDASRPYYSLLSKIQCIGGFGPQVNNASIRNNLCVTGGTIHGITIGGMNGGDITNNTIQRLYDDDNNQDPKIIIYETSSPYNYTPANVTIRNNTYWTGISTSGSGHTIDHNLEVTAGNQASLWVDWSNENYYPKAGSGLINTGSDTAAPLNDIRGYPRPIGTTDIGCYEYGSNKYLLILN